MSMEYLGNPMQVPEKNIQNQKEKELTAEEKRQAVLAWKEMVLGVETVPENVDQLNDSEIKKWFSQSLNLEIDNLAKDWGLEPDLALIRKISEAENAQEKSAAQVEYIQTCSSRIQKLVSEFKEPPRKSTKWNSWPKTMREHKSFNCVGASLLGQCLLKKAGIENYLGSPVGHAIDIAHLENGDWWYVDFLNKSVKQIKPKETEIEGCRVLSVDDSDVLYRYVGIQDVSAAPAYIVGNLGCLVDEANSEDIPDEDIDKIAAKNFLAEHAELFEKVNFEELLARLYSGVERFATSQEMENEKKRIDLIFSSSDDIQELIEKKNLNKNIQTIRENFKNNVEVVKNFLLTGDEALISSLDYDSRSVLKIYNHQLERVKEINVEVYEELKALMISKIADC